MKPFSVSLSILTLASTIFSSQTIPAPIEPKRTNTAIAKFDQSHFVYEGGLSTPKEYSDNECGYLYLDIGLYSTAFTKTDMHSSRLFIVCCNADFTPGCIAYKNGETEYNKDAKLKEGYLHVTLGSYENEDLLCRSSSYTVHNFAPESSTSTISVSTAYGLQYDISNSFAESVSLNGDISAKRVTNSGLSFSFSNSATITTSEPELSSQRSPSNLNTLEWSFTYNKIGTVTYHLQTYTIAEVLDDGRGYEDYAFSVKLDYSMTSQVPSFLWFTTNKSFSGSYMFRFRDQMI